MTIGVLRFMYLMISIILIWYVGVKTYIAPSSPLHIYLVIWLRLHLAVTDYLKLQLSTVFYVTRSTHYNLLRQTFNTVQFVTSHGQHTTVCYVTRSTHYSNHLTNRLNKWQKCINYSLLLHTFNTLISNQLTYR